MSAAYQTFPMVMSHPNHVPATTRRVDNGTPGMRGEMWAGDMQGTPEKFPPVTVHNEDQEEYHRSQGYVSAGDAEEFNVARNNLNPSGYGFQEFPKWIDDGTPEGATVNTADEEAALRSRLIARRGATTDPQPIPKVPDSVQTAGPTAEELAEFRQWKAAQEAAAASSVETKTKRAARPKASYAERTRGTAAASSAGDAPDA